MICVFFPADDYPDIEIVAAVGGLSGDTSGTLRSVFGITEEFYQRVYRHILGKVDNIRSTFRPLSICQTLIRFLSLAACIRSDAGVTPSFFPRTNYVEKPESIPLATDAAELFH